MGARREEEGLARVRPEPAHPFGHQLRVGLLLLAARVDKPRMLDVLRKTLRKMSEPAKRLALTIEMPGRERTLVEEALSS